MARLSARAHMEMEGSPGGMAGTAVPPEDTAGMPRANRRSDDAELSASCAMPRGPRCSSSSSLPLAPSPSAST